MRTLRRIHGLQWSLALCVALGLWLLWQPQVARAETITVTTTLDAGAGSLRQAIADAAPGATIVFSDTLAGQTITLTGQLEIAKNLTLSSAVPITVSGDNYTRVFNIAPGVAATLRNLTIARGESDGGNGGGILNQGVLTVTNCALDDNLAYPAPYSGGGIYNADIGVLTVISSTFTNNGAAGAGAGIYNDGVAEVYDSTFSDNQAESGGGIYNAGALQVTRCTFSANTAAHAGGGLYNSAGMVTVKASTFSSNTATRYGGGLYTTGETATATVIASTLTNNRTTHTPWVNGYGGGGLYNNKGTLNVQNSTLANNAAPWNSGGGLYNAGATIVQASTLSGNSADYGGGIWNASGILELRQTIVANSSAGHDCHTVGGAVYSVASLFEATGYNACGSYIHYDSILGVDPLLGPLADNGGATQTFALLPNSPAIDTAGGWTCLAADQRGEPRADLVCDIGAFELQHRDSDTVVKTGLTVGKTATFGPTRVRLTITDGDAGTITATKRLATPGGVYDTGEITATWYLTASHSPFTVTLAFCYTAEEFGDPNTDGLQAFRWNTTTLTWTLPISTGLTVADGCVTLTGIEEFSAWTLFDTGKGATPTAVTLRSLAARDGVWGLGVLSVLAAGVAWMRRKQFRFVGGKNEAL